MCVRPIISNLATDLYEIFKGGRTMAVDERSEVSFFDIARDVAVATNFWLNPSTNFFYRAISLKRHQIGTYM